MYVRIRTAFAIAVIAVLLAGCGAAVVPQIHDDSDRVNLARRMIAKGDWAIAIDVLTPYVTTGVGSADIDDAIYLLGMAQLHQKDWALAQAQFERILRDYPESDSAQSSAYRLGEALFGQARGPDFDQEFTLKALNQFEQYEKTASGHWLAGEGEKRILECRTRLATKLYRTADLYLKLKEYKSARRYYSDVIDQYSDTAPYGDALIGAALADARMGRKVQSLTSLDSLGKAFAGKPLGDKAALWRTRVAKWPDAGDLARKAHKPVEAPATPVPGGPTQPQSYTP